MTGVNATELPARFDKGVVHLETPTLFQHLLVAIDRRAGAHRTVALSLRVASLLGARVTVLFVVTQPSRAVSATGEHRSHEAINAGERVFRGVRRMASAVGVSCVCLYAFGRDAQMIVNEAATEHHCDLIIINTPETTATANDAVDCG